MDDLLRWLNGNFKLLGVLAIGLCVGTWALDLAELVHPCVYCRTQRTAIGVVGALMLVPQVRAWWLRWAVAAFCFFGAHTSVSQLFLIVKSINSGEPFGALNLFMATGALFVLTGQCMLVFMKENES
jgi:disulfide bond formation protein DsbB